MSRLARQITDLGEVVGVLECNRGVKELIRDEAALNYVRKYPGMTETGEETEEEFQRKARNYPVNLMLIQLEIGREKAKSFTVHGEEALRKLSEFLAARFAEADEAAAGEALKAYNQSLAEAVVDSVIGVLCINGFAGAYPKALEMMKNARVDLNSAAENKLTWFAVDNKLPRHKEKLWDDGGE